MSVLGVLSGLGNSISGIVNSGLGIANYMRNINLQQQQWNREDTAYQRAVADLESAGLSKTLISGGASSSTSYQDSPQVSNPVADYLQGLTMKKQLDEIDANIRNTEADASYKNSLSILNGIKGNMFQYQLSELLPKRLEQMNTSINECLSRIDNLVSSTNLNVLSYDKVKAEIENILADTLEKELSNTVFRRSGIKPGNNYIGGAAGFVTQGIPNLARFAGSKASDILGFIRSGTDLEIEQAVNVATSQVKNGVSPVKSITKLVSSIGSWIYSKTHDFNSDDSGFINYDEFGNML